MNTRCILYYGRLKAQHVDTIMFRIKRSTQDVSNMNAVSIKGGNDTECKHH